jgi:lysophospholipase
LVRLVTIDLALASAEPRRRTLPPGGALNITPAADGWPLRTAVWPAAQGRPTLLLLNGRGDFLEKYAETYWDLVAQGIGLITWDWRGQGGSGRLTPDPYKGHANDFGVWLADLAFLVDQLAPPGPLAIAGHSMGGHLALRALHDTPQRFSKAVLLSPMIGINAGPFPPGLTRRMVRMAVSAGQGERYAIGQRPYGALMRSTLRQERLTTDASRFADDIAFLDANPTCAMGGATFGWVDAAQRSLDVIHATGYAESISTPTLLLLAEQELLTDTPAALAYAKRMPQARAEIIPNARHELLKEADATRAAVISRLSDFLELA